MVGGIILGIINKGDFFVFFILDGIFYDCFEEIIDGYCLFEFDVLIGIGGDGSLVIFCKFV